MKQITKQIYNNRGYTLLFAAMTAAVVLGVAVFITSVSRKQFILSATARDSLFAVYNADSAIECAALSLENITRESGGTFSCNGVSVAVPYSEDSPVSPLPPGFLEAYSPPEIIVSFAPDRGCAKVTYIFGIGLTGDSKTFVEALGYNLDEPCQDPPPATLPPRVVERAIRLTYE